jgi:hypothetical protein
MEILFSLSPDQIIRDVSDEVSKGWLPAAEIIEARRRDFLKKCRATGIHPQLVEQRKKLEALKLRQEASR